MVRPIRPEDSAEWLRMRRALWPDCSEEMHQLEIKEQSRGDRAAVYVFERAKGGLAGFIELSIRDRVDGCLSPKVAYIEGWYVDPDLRAQGIGRFLVEQAESWARENALTELASDAEIANKGSIHAHKALGFQETFRLVHFRKSLER